MKFSSTDDMLNIAIKASDFITEGRHGFQLSFGEVMDGRTMVCETGELGTNQELSPMLEAGTDGQELGVKRIIHIL